MLTMCILFIIVLIATLLPLELLMMQIFVKNPQGKTTTLNVEKNERVCIIKSNLKEKEGICSDLHLGLIYNGMLLEDGRTLAQCGISKQCTFHLFLSQDAIPVEPCTLFVKPWSQDVFILKFKREESVDDVKAKIQEEKGIPSHKQLLFNRGKWLEDGSRTLADYNIFNTSTLDLAIQLEQGPQSAAATQPDVTSQEAPPQTKRARPATPTKATSKNFIMQIFVINPQGETTTLNVEKNERVCIIKSKLKEKEGIRSDMHLVLIYNGNLLDDGHTLSRYGISKSKQCTLRFFLSQDAIAAEPYTLFVKPWSQNVFILKVKREESIDDVKAKIQEEKGIPSHKQLLFRSGRWLEDGSRTLADYYISNPGSLDLAIQVEPGPQSAAVSQPNVTSQEAQRQTKRARSATPTKATSIKATAALSDLMPESQACPPSSVLEDVKSEMATACNKKKELEATISRLEAENKKNEQELMIARNKEKELEATVSGLKAENKKTEKELTLARNKEKELEATISRLKAENKKTEEELTIVRNNEKGLESSISNKKTEEEFTLARNKEKKELETTISALTHKNKVFSDQCALYESLVDDLEVENKKTKEELLNADKKYYAGARAAGYAEGLKEGKAKRQKSLEFLHHLTDASMRYFNHGFDSCQKQAEEQGFCGQLNKDSALKDAPDLKGWESSDQSH